jgi:hypothetical protein
VGERQDTNNAGGAVERVTIAEAASLLGCHPNTVRSRVRAGIYKAEKVLTERGPTWMIDRDSLINNTPTSARQQGVSGVPALQQEALQELARQIVRETVLAKDTEREALLEASKLKVEVAKTQVLISSGSLVGIAAVVKVLPTGQHLFFLLGAVFFICLSVLGGFLWMGDVARAVTALRRPPREITWFGPLLLAMGLFMFGLYVFYNVPWEHAAGLLAWAEARIVLRGLTLVLVGSGIALIAVVLLQRRIEAPQGASEGAEPAEETPDRAEPHSATGGAQEGAQRRPWWKRVFRG